MDDEFKELIVGNVDYNSLTIEEKNDLWEMIRKEIVQTTFNKDIIYDKSVYLKLGKKIIEGLKSRGHILEPSDKAEIYMKYKPTGYFRKFKAIAILVDEDDPWGISVEKNENEDTKGRIKYVF